MNRQIWTVYIEDILESMDKIERYIKGLSFEEFASNELIKDAVLRKPPGNETKDQINAEYLQ